MSADPTVPGDGPVPGRHPAAGRAPREPCGTRPDTTPLDGTRPDTAPLVGSRLDGTLLGEVTPDRPLLVVALPEEATHLRDLGLPVLFTGVGLVNAAEATARTLAVTRPAAVVNIGTAGALRPGLTGVHEIGRVTQRSLDAAAVRALTGRDPAPAVDLGPGATLSSGDDFVSDPAVRDRLAEHADLCDMEGYAVCAAARAAGVPVRLVKLVSDDADDVPGGTWWDSVERCAVELGRWARHHLARPGSWPGA